MKKTVKYITNLPLKEEYIKPLICEALVPSDQEINYIKQYYEKKKQSGSLEQQLRDTMEKQSRAFTKSGPHPHH